MRKSSALLVGLFVFLAQSMFATDIAAAQAAVTTAQADWLTSGNSLQRTGENPGETTLSPSTVGGLHQIWSTTLSGNIDNPPVYAARVKTKLLGFRDMVFVGTERGIFAGLDAHTGQVIWSRHLGFIAANCHGVMVNHGVTAAAAIDRVTGRIYVVSGTGLLFALRLGTGSTVTGFPVAITSTPGTEHVWGGLNIYQGQVYLTIAGMCDLPPYVGQVIAVSTATAQITSHFEVEPSSGPYGGGIWGWGGASIDPDAGAVYVSTGNALAKPENVGYAEDVLRLDANLSVVAEDKPPLNGVDEDFGSTPVLFQAPGCLPQLAVQKKGGLLYLYNRDSIASGPAQVLQITPLGEDFIGMPAWSQANGLLYVSNPVKSTKYVRGLIAFSDTAPGCTLSLRWQTAAGTVGGIPSPPTIANGVVYATDGSGDHQVRAFDAITGDLLWSSGTAMQGAAYPAPTVINGMVYVSSGDHAIHAFGV